MNRHIPFALVFLSVLIPLQVRAAFLDDWAKMKPITPHGYVCYRAAEPLNIDGRMDEAAWNRAPWTDDFQDIEGSAKPKPRFRTRAKMLWDENYFYIAAELEEPHLWGTLTNHDAVIFQDNDFEVFIDPEGDTHDYFEFEMNALNTTWDLLLKKRYIDGGPALNEWEIPGLKSAVHLVGTINNSADRDQRWTLEIAFPWKSLSPQPGQGKAPRDGEQWRVNFSRVEWQIDIKDGKYLKVPKTPENNWVWSPQGIIDMHRPEKWGYVQFSSAISGSVKLTRDPSERMRDALQTIYYAQRDFQATNHRWASSLRELGLPKEHAIKGLPPVSLQLTQDGFDARGDVKPGRAAKQRWHIRHDGKVWRE